MCILQVNVRITPSSWTSLIVKINIKCYRLTSSHQPSAYLHNCLHSYYGMKTLLKSINFNWEAKHLLMIPTIYSSRDSLTIFEGKLVNAHYEVCCESAESFFHERDAGLFFTLLRRINETSKSDRTAGAYRFQMLQFRTKSHEIIFSPTWDVNLRFEFSFSCLKILHHTQDFTSLFSTVLFFLFFFSFYSCRCFTHWTQRDRRLQLMDKFQVFRPRKEGCEFEGAFGGCYLIPFRRKSSQTTAFLLQSCCSYSSKRNITKTRVFVHTNACTANLNWLDFSLTEIFKTRKSF